MSNKKKLIPALRFPEFKEDGEWEEKRLGEVFELGSGRDYKHLNPGDIPVYGSGGYMLSVNKYLYEGESVCIGRKGTIDKPMFLSGKFWTVDTLFYTHSFKGSSPKFIFYIFQKINWINHNEAGGIPSLSKTVINKIAVTLPNLSEQQKIADCLSSLDDLLAAHNEKLELLKGHKKGLMQNLFPQEGERVPKFRFPEFENDGEWEEKKLGEILIKHRLGGNYENTKENAGIPLIKMGNIERGSINLENIQYLPINTLYNDDDILKEGDLLFNTRNTLELVGKVAIWRNELPFALYNSNLMRMTFDDKLISSNSFMNHLFNTRTWINKLKAVATGTTSVAAIYTKDLHTIMVSFPSKSEQQKIASCLSAVDDLIKAETGKIEALKAHKKGLMQGLFPKMEN